MIATPVQCDVDGIPKGSHYVLLKQANTKDLFPGRPHGLRSYERRNADPVNCAVSSAE
jgi:hypothetical protein